MCSCLVYLYGSSHICFAVEHKKNEKQAFTIKNLSCGVTIKCFVRVIFGAEACTHLYIYIYNLKETKEISGLSQSEANSLTFHDLLENFSLSIDSLVSGK